MLQQETLSEHGSIVPRKFDFSRGVGLQEHHAVGELLIFLAIFLPVEASSVAAVAA